MTCSTFGAARKNGAGGRPQATVIRAPGTCRAISRITPDEMTQSPMRLEVTKSTFFSDTRFCLRSLLGVRYQSATISARGAHLDPIERLARPDGETLALRRVAGAGPTVVWIGGFRSDMEGTKALALHAAASARGWAFVRYDHFAHGESSGDWRRATIGRWREDAIALVDSLEGPVIAVGSSMGGWIALLLALARPERMAGLVLVNPAHDFTERLMWPGLADHVRRAILRDGEALIDDEGLGPYVLTRAMFEEARNWLLLDGPIRIVAPVHILQGRADDVVPWGHATALADRLTGGAVTLDLIEDGDHRLSRPVDIQTLVEALERNRHSSSTLR